MLKNKTRTTVQQEKHVFTEQDVQDVKKKVEEA